MERVPLASVGALPQPAVAAAVPTSAAEAVPPTTPVSIAAPRARASTAAPPTVLRGDITWLPLSAPAIARAGCEQGGEAGCYGSAPTHSRPSFDHPRCAAHNDFSLPIPRAVPMAVETLRRFAEKCYARRRRAVGTPTRHAAHRRA